MNFYQSQLRKTINTQVLGKPLVQLELLGKQYRGTLKQQTVLGQSLRRWMIQGVKLPEDLGVETRHSESKRLQSQLQHGRGDFLLQLGCTTLLDRTPTRSLKSPETKGEIRTKREALQQTLYTKYQLQPGLRTHMPDATIVLDLTLSEDDYRKTLSRSAKRYINKGKKAGLEFNTATYDQREEFREVWYDTGFMKGFHVLPREQLLRLRDYCLSEGVGQLYLGLIDGKIVTGAVYLYHDTQMIYLYGATDRVAGDIGAQYRLTDQIIRSSRGRSYTSLDLLGVAPVGYESGHARGGVTRFKQSFGGETISYRGSYDLIFNPWVMKAFERKRKLGKLKSGK